MLEGLDMVQYFPSDRQFIDSKPDVLTFASDRHLFVLMMMVTTTTTTVRVMVLVMVLMMMIMMISMSMLLFMLMLILKYGIEQYIAIISRCFRTRTVQPGKVH